MARRKKPVEPEFTLTHVEKEKPKENKNIRRAHIVTWGDTIESIAHMYNVSVSKLIKLNGVEKIAIGQVLFID